MRREILYIDPQKLTFRVKFELKMQKPTLPKFEISILENSGFGKMRNRDSKTLKFDFDFEFLSQKFDFENFKIVLSNSYRISIRDPKI